MIAAIIVALLAITATAAFTLAALLAHGAATALAVAGGCFLVMAFIVSICGAELGWFER